MTEGAKRDFEISPYSAYIFSNPADQPIDQAHHLLFCCFVFDSICSWLEISNGRNTFTEKLFQENNAKGRRKAKETIGGKPNIGNQAEFKHDTGIGGWEKGRILLDSNQNVSLVLLYETVFYLGLPCFSKKLSSVLQWQVA